MALERAGGLPTENPPTSDPHRGDTEVQSGSPGANDTAPDSEWIVLPDRAKWYGICPGICGHEFDITRTATGYLVGSFSASCPHGRECIRSLAAAATEHWGQPLNGGQILHEPLRWLAPWLGRKGRRAATPSMPSVGQIAGWHSALLASCEPLAYLRNHRGLTLDTLQRYGVGWDRDRGDLTFPAWENDQPIYLYRRKPRDRAKMIAQVGPRPFYPDLPPERALVLVAGEIDALIGRQIGLRTVTVSGCQLPLVMARRLSGRTVYVMFDVGEEGAAESAAEKARQCGATAHVARLARLGLPDKADLNDLYRKCGAYTPTVLRCLLRTERGRSAA